MTTAVVVTAIFTPADGQCDAVHATLLPAIASVHLERGCLLYSIHQAPDGSIVMIEKWESDRLLNEHGAGSAVAALNASLEGKLARPIEVTRLSPLPAGSPAQGTL